jgi:hypothetical protein
LLACYFNNNNNNKVDKKNKNNKQDRQQEQHDFQCAVLSNPTPELIDQAAKLYPGRASCGNFHHPVEHGPARTTRTAPADTAMSPVLIDGVQRVAAEFGERVLVSPCNSISIGLTVSQSLAPLRDPQAESQAEATGEEGRKHVDAAFIGSMLFKRSISSAIIAASSEMKTMPVRMIGRILCTIIYYLLFQYIATAIFI